MVDETNSDKTVQKKKTNGERNEIIKVQYNEFNYQLLLSQENYYLLEETIKKLHYKVYHMIIQLKKQRNLKIGRRT